MTNFKFILRSFTFALMTYEESKALSRALSYVLGSERVVRVSERVSSARSSVLTVYKLIKTTAEWAKIV